MPRLSRENTLTSFALALEAGADGIELDVHVSADGVVVVQHDPVLTSPRVPLAELTAEELAPHGVATLDEVCMLVGRRAALYVEAKAAHSAAAIVECLTAHDVRAAVHSFDHRVVDGVRALAPMIPVGLLISEEADVAALIRAHAARDLWPAVHLVDAKLVETAHAVGSRVIAWTANDVADARRLQLLGVDGLCTDDVRLLRSALQP